MLVRVSTGKSVLFLLDFRKIMLYLISMAHPTLSFLIVAHVPLVKPIHTLSLSRTKGRALEGSLRVSPEPLLP